MDFSLEENGVIRKKIQHTISFSVRSDPPVASLLQNRFHILRSMHFSNKTQWAANDPENVTTFTGTLEHTGESNAV